MTLAILLGIYILMNAYIMLRTGLFVRRNWPGSRGRLAAGLIVLACGVLAATLPIAFALEQGGLHKALLTVGNAVEGFTILLLFAYVVLEIICLLLRLIPAGRRLVRAHGPRKLALGAAVWAVCLMTCVYGTLHASQLTVKRYDVRVAKPCGSMDSLRVALVADLHLGNTIGARRVQDMVRVINEQDADLVIFAGDIFDNSVDEMYDPEAVKEALRSIESRLGVYGCWGNHDVRGRLFSGFTTDAPGTCVRTPAMDDFMSDSGVTMLADEAVLVDGSLWLVGRKDYSNDGEGGRSRAALEALLSPLDMSLPVLVMDHQPRFLQESADAGVDVLFSGHTHDGQTFPINLVMNREWEKPSGMLIKGSMASIVTSGVGLYGPDMRLGTDADVTVVDISFAQR